LIAILDKHGFKILEIKQRQPIYNFEFQSERIYLIAEKIKELPSANTHTIKLIGLLQYLLFLLLP